MYVPVLGIILSDSDPEIDAALLGKTLDERIALVDAMRAEHSAAKQRLEDERRAAEGPAKSGSAKAIRRHDELVDMIDAMAPRGHALLRTRERLMRELSNVREGQRLSELAMFRR